MSRKVQLLLFLGGAAVFAYLVARAGLAQLAANAVQTGWMFVPILLVYGLSYVCNAWAWWLMLADEPSRPPFWRTLAITVSGFSINFLTPLVNVGGEPFKVAAVAPWLGTRRAVGSVVLYQMLHTVAILLTWLTALGLALVFLPRTPLAVTAIALGAAALVALTALLLSAHRQGVLERTLNLLHRLPLLERLARVLEPWRVTLAQMDGQITDFYHRDPRRFFQALGLEYLSRCILMLEYFLILLSVGMHVGYLRAFVIGGLESIVGNVLFVFPYELGTKEGALYLLFPLLGLAPALGVYAAIVSRLRDLTWIAFGVALIWVSGHRRPVTESA